MALREDIEKQGNWLFRWRSYLPLLILPLLVVSLRQTRALERLFGDRVSDYWETLAIFISFTGLLFRCLTAGFVPRGTSGRNTKYQVAETLNTTGMYSIVRNPLYVGNFIIFFGITLFVQAWWLALIIWISFWLYYERIIFSEEEFLRKKFGEAFIAWAEKTPMLLPNVTLWRKPGLPFSFKTMVRREFTTFFAISASFFFLEAATNYLLTGKLSVGRSWTIFFVIGAIAYLTCLFLKKKTKLLNVEGR